MANNCARRQPTENRQYYNDPSYGRAPGGRQVSVSGGARQNPYRRTGSTQNPHGRNGFDENVPKKRFPVLFTLLTVVCVGAAGLLVSLIGMNYRADYVETIRPTTSVTAAEDSADAQINEAEVPVETTAEPPEETSDPTEYDFSKPVPESAEHDASIFESAAFIGDSRTVGLIQATKIQTHNYSSVGMNISALTTKSYIRVKNDDDTFSNLNMLEALERDKDEIKTIYIALGLNELGWEPNAYIKAYRKVVNEIREIIDVPIYIQLILPMTEDAYKASIYGVTNDDQLIFNEKLSALAEEMQLFLLDPRGLFETEDGMLDPECASDGIHLNGASYRKLLSYYLTHVVDIEQYKNIEFTKGE